MDVNFLEILVAIVTVVGGIYAAIRWGKDAAIAVWRWLTRYRPRVPRETVRILPQMRGCWWSMGSVSGKPAMQVVGRWYVTNITGDPVLLLAAQLTKPPTDGHVLVKHPEQNVFGRYPILPGATTEGSSDFWVIPPRRKEGEDFISDVLLIDQYSNRHRIKKVRFHGPSVAEPQKEEPQVESVHSITDPIEKQVVAVLKTEVYRYKECGRRVGGLGSIQTIYQDHRYTGVGTELREADSPKNQSIVPDPDKVTIESDNATALLKLYGKLDREEQKSHFVEALLERLSKKNEYAPIGYFILYVLFQIGHLQQALEKAKQDLRGDPAYGFSDLLRLLDALLRFKHPQFDSGSLDEIERFTEGLTEHAFRIRERLAAIRTTGLSE